MTKLWWKNTCQQICFNKNRNLIRTGNYGIYSQDFFHCCIFTILPHLVLCEHLRLRIKKEQLLQTVDSFRDGQNGNLSRSRMLWAAGRQPVQQVAAQLQTHNIPCLLDLKEIIK